MILDGLKVSRMRNDALKEKIDVYVKKGFRKPKLAIILVGENQASITYVTHKIKACNRVGIEAVLKQFDAGISEASLKQEIEALNQDDTIDGIIIQLPIPKHIDSLKMINMVQLDKDVDGFTTMNQGLLFQKNAEVYAATPQGILNLLDHYQIKVEGMNAVVIGRSNIVGIPISKMLLDLNATVSTLHSKTKDIKAYTKQADLLVVAIGQPNFVTKEMVKPGAIVIDVGINRVEGHLVGDVDFNDVSKCAGMITPVPKGIGPMTINALLENTVKLYLKHIA